MTKTSTATAESVLAAARDRHSVAVQAEIDKLQLAVEWVLLHPGDEVDDSVGWSMRDMEIAGEGAPTIDEGAIAEFALAIGVSTDSGRNYLGDAVELNYRLPRIWNRVVSGMLPAWKARKISQATMSLPPEAAGFVDRHLYFAAHKCSFAEIDRQVEKARAEYDPVETERRRVEAAEHRHVKTHLWSMTSEGLVPITAMVEVADAVAFEEFVTTEADRFDPMIPLQVRRSMVLGRLGSGDGPPEAHREVVIYAHTRPGQAMVEVENTRSVITPDHLRELCRQAGTKVTVRPVIDLNEELSTDSYRPTEVMKEQMRLRFPQCPFPWCHRPSRRSDGDHIVRWPTGATTTSNLAPPCRTHHRLKTHTDWNHEYVPGVGFVWTSPLGHRHIG